MWGKESGRFYQADGTLREDVGLTQARKEGLFPSVSEILMTFRESYGLTKWKNEQLIMAAVSTPREEDDTDETFIERVLEASKEEAVAAAETGTNYHAAIAEKLAGNAVAMPKRVHEWVEEHLQPGAETEKTLVNRIHGIAGTTDYLGPFAPSQELACIDFKSQSVKGTARVPSPRWYENWPLQIAAYRSAIGHTGGIVPQLGVSVVINTNPKHPVYTEENPGIWHRVWTEEELMMADLTIRSLAAVWFLVNKWHFQSPDAIGAMGTPLKSRGSFYG